MGSRTIPPGQYFARAIFPWTLFPGQYPLDNIPRTASISVIDALFSSIQNILSENLFLTCTCVQRLEEFFAFIQLPFQIAIIYSVSIFKCHLLLSGRYYPEAIVQGDFVLEDIVLIGLIFHVFGRFLLAPRSLIDLHV